MRNKVFLIFLLVLALVLQACGAEPTQAPVTQAPEIPTQPPAQPEIVHSVFPSGGGSPVSNAHDNEESETYQDKSVRAGDDFRTNRFERPFTSIDMDYLPHIDIFDISMTEDDNFYYVQIKLVGVDPETGGANGTYAVDFDLNIDGKAELIVIYDHPASSEWTTDGLAILIDENNDVGGQSIFPDDAYTGDGFETPIFVNGAGIDPDAAWGHFVNSADPIVEIAFKKELLEENSKFMWSVTTSLDPLDPKRFYFNDTYSEKRAGSPVKGHEYYPVNELAAIDNTCRLPAGFQPTGTEPLGCNVAGPTGGGRSFSEPGVCTINPYLCWDWGAELLEYIIFSP